MNEKIENLILSSEEYLSIKFTTPYVIKISGQDKELVYVGVQHSMDLENEQFKVIESLWADFIKDKEASNVLAVVESGLRKTELDKESAILKHGEPGLLVFLAQQQGVDVQCFEPDRRFLMNQFLDKYSKEEIFYNHIAQVILQWNRFSKKPNFEEYINQFILRDRDNSGWVDFDFSFENAKKIHKNMFDKEINIHDKEFFNENLNPHLKLSVLNSISKSYNTIREVKIVEGILESWNKGNSVFVVYGSGHAIVQERALRSLLK